MSEKNQKILYQCNTSKFCYYVIAKDPTSAKNKVENMLNEENYGFQNQREVHVIKKIASQIQPALNHKHFLSGDDILICD